MCFFLILEKYFDDTIRSIRHNEWICPADFNSLNPPHAPNKRSYNGTKILEDNEFDIDKACQIGTYRYTDNYDKYFADPTNSQDCKNAIGEFKSSVLVNTYHTPKEIEAFREIPGYAKE